MERLITNLRDGVVYVEGEIDPSTAGQLTDAIAKCATDIRLDLSGCTFMDSTGISTLIEADNVARARQVALTLIAPSTPVRRLLEVCGMTDVFTIEATHRATH